MSTIRLDSGLLITAPFAQAGQGSVAVSKALSDGGAIGAAMNDAAISGQLWNEFRAWQQSMLRDAAIHWWLYKKNPWVRTCVDLIVQRATADDYSVESESDNETAIKALEKFLALVNPKQSFIRLMREVYRDLQINGNSYVRVQFAGKLPTALFRVDFRTIVPQPVKSGWPEFFSHYQNGRSDMAPAQIPAEQIIHITLNDTGENGMGLSPLESLDYTLAIDQAAITFNQGFLNNGAKAGDIYSMDKEMSPEQVDREREQLKENFTKPSQAYEPMFIQGIELVRDGTKIHKDMDFVNLRKWDREEVLGVYSIPGSLVTMEVGGLGANGKEQDSILFNEAVIAPLQKQVYEDWNRELLRERFNNEDVTIVAPKIAGVRLDLVNTAGAMLKAGATANEARRVMRLDDQEGDNYNQPIFEMGGLAIVGGPGDPDSILYTPRGAFLGDPQDPAELAEMQAQALATQGQTNGQGSGAQGQQNGAKPGGAKPGSKPAAGKAPTKSGGSAQSRSTSGAKATNNGDGGKSVSKAEADSGLDFEGDPEDLPQWAKDHINHAKLELDSWNAGMAARIVAAIKHRLS